MNDNQTSTVEPGANPFAERAAAEVAKPKKASVLSLITKQRRRRPFFGVLYGPPGVGKCLGKGTPVMMADGSIKPVERVQEGDELMGPDSQPRTVRNLSRGIGPLFRITPTKGQSWVCNENHVLTLFRGHEFWSEVIDIPLNKYLQLSCYEQFRHKLIHTGVEFADHPTALDPYFVGLWIAEGSRSSGSVQLSSADQEIIQYVKDFADSLGLFFNARPNPNSRICKTLIVTNYSGKGRGKNCEKIGHSQQTHLIRGLRECGMKQSEKTIPAAYLRNSKAKRLALLAGLLDGDGHLINNCFEIATVSQGLRDQYIYLAASLGFQVSHNRKTIGAGKVGAGNVYYRVHISGDTDIIPTKLPRKKAPARQQIKDELHYGFRIEPINDGEYFGFELDRDGRFLLGDFTVTHNSTFASESPEPIFIPCERGLDQITTNKFPTPKTLAEFGSYLKAIEEEPNDYQTLVIDTADALELLISDAVCAEGKVKSLEEFGGGWSKGNLRAREYWARLLVRLTAMSESRTVLLLAHSHLRTINDPMLATAFDVYEMKIQAKSAELIRQSVDLLLFARMTTTVAKDTPKAKKGRGLVSGDREMYTQPTTGIESKNRYNLESPMEFSWAALQDGIDKFYS